MVLTHSQERLSVIEPGFTLSQSDPGLFYVTKKTSSWRAILDVFTIEAQIVILAIAFVNVLVLLIIDRNGLTLMEIASKLSLFKSLFGQSFSQETYKKVKYSFESFHYER